MKQTLIGLVFILGCATGGIASQLVIPPARAAIPPTRWEYLCAQGDVSTQEFNKVGAQGWELATMNVFHRISKEAAFCFKRRIDS